MSSVDRSSTAWSSSKLPLPLRVAALIWLVLPLVRLWPEIEAGTLISDPRGIDAPLIRHTLQVTSAYVITALVLWGVTNRVPFTYWLAIPWQITIAGFGAYNLYINRYGWEAITSFGQIPFFHGALPIATGLTSIVLLLLPGPLRWISEGVGTYASLRPREESPSDSKDHQADD